MCFKQYTIFASLVSLTLSERTLPLPTWDTISNLWDPEGKNQQIGQMDGIVQLRLYDREYG